MATEIGVLSGEDISILRRLIDREKVQRKNSPIQEEFQPDYGSPDIYLAYPQDEIRAWTDTPGTGDDLAGTGQADIYKLVKESGDYHIEKIPNLSRLIYNHGDAISDGPIIVARDKFGYWIPLIGAAGGGGGILATFTRFPVASDNDPYYDADFPCRWAYVAVKRTTCDGSPTLGDTLRAWDDMGCWFDWPEVNLAGVSLLLEKTKGSGESVGTGTPADTGTGTDGVVEDDPSCHWTVFNRCCVVDDS